MVRVPEQAQPLVSIAMPVFNNESTIGASVRSVVAQTYSNWELLVVDDGSTDATVSVVKSFADDPRIRVVRDGAHRGLVPRLNEAISIARGKYLARFDGDDVCYPERLSRQIHYLEQHDAIDVVGTPMLVFGDGGVIRGQRPCPPDHEAICARPTSGFKLWHPTYCGRLEWFRSFGYNQAAIRCEDQDLLFRSYRTSRFANLERIEVGYRESSIALRKILSSRYHLARMLMNHRADLRKSQLVAGVVAQVAKGAVDTTAVMLHLERTLLRHRFVPIPPSERRRWNEIWRLVCDDTRSDLRVNR